MLRQWMLWVVVTGCGACAWAQKPLDIPPVAAPTPLAGAGPITLDVVVTDKAGNPIAGLKQEDFSLLDNKQPAAIRSFAAHELGAPGEKSDAVGLFLLIDDVNADFNIVSTVRTQIENYLRADGGHLAMPLGIFLLTDTGLTQVTPVSTDGNALASALHQKDGQLHQIPRSAGFYGGEERLEISLQGIATLGQYLGKADGRKLVVWIGPGWPIFDNPNVMISPQQQRKLFSTVVELSSMLREAGITIDSVDPLGPSDAASARNFLWESFMKPVAKPSKADPGNLALQVFAMHTGGTVEAGSNDITGEITRCAKDAKAWYSLSFDPQKTDTPNAWHDVQVKVDRPNVKVRTDNGYYAQP